MAFVENFTGGQNSGTPSTVTFTDTSTGTDLAITQRRIFLLQADGTYLTGNGTINYNPWALVNSTISLDVLSQDTALSVTVQWLDVSNTVLYSKTIAFGFDAFGQNFFYGLSDGQVPITNPSVALSTNYYQNKLQFYCYLVSAAQAITRYGDIYKAQDNYDADQFMISNQNDFF